MRIDELDDEPVKKAVFTFGRLNPPHFGHHALIQTLQKEAQKQGCDWFLFVSSKTGDEKNPLTYEQKVWWIQALFPETKGHLIVDPSIKTPLVAATWLYKKGYHAATFVAGEDDMASYGEMIKSGNAHGQKNPDALKIGKGFFFQPLDFAISPRLASATNARRNVTDGDPEAFVRSILGPKINPKLAELVQDQLYPTLRKAMGLSESIEESYYVFPSVKEIAQHHITTPAEVHRQISRGVKVEFEKNQDIETATDIAMSNIAKNLKHYIDISKKKFGENFADGKGPGRSGDSQRHGIPKHATMSELEQASHANGRKGQLARWQLNMRRGKKKANEDGFAFAAGPGGNADGSNLLDRQVGINPWDVETPVTEVADQPYKPIIQSNRAEKFVAIIPQTDSGSRIQIRITQETADPGTVEVGFFDETDQAKPTIAVTGKGDAFRIFATVGAVVSMYVKKFAPDSIEFGGKSSEGGRIKLYDMIARNIGRYLPGYKLDQDHEDFQAGEKRYKFSRANENVNEAKKIKKPKTIIDGAVKTLINKGRSEDEAIADLKKEIDGKFYDLTEATDYSRGEELEGIDIMGAPVFISHHAIERLDRKGERSVDVEEIYEIIEKAVRQNGRDIAKLHNTDFILKGENGPPREPKNGLGLAIAKIEDSAGNPVYLIKTVHPRLLVDKSKPGFRVQGLKRRYSMYEEVEDNHKPRVYLDMDGVLADFFGEWARLAKVGHYKDINNPEETLQLVRDHPTFWIDLPMLPHARALVKTVIEQYGEYRICSKPLENDPRSRPGKMEWIRKNLSDMMPVEVVLTADKSKYAVKDGEPNILVDDFGVNINAWKAAGGIGIKYDDPSFPKVANVLTKLAK